MNVEQLELLYIIHGNVKWYKPIGEFIRESFDPAIALSDIYQREMKMCVYKSLETNTHRSFINNSPQNKTT